MPTFHNGQRVIDMLGGDATTRGRVYRVVNSYDGHSGCGPQEWVRIINDKGQIAGYDPDRFIPFMGDKEAADPLACALHLKGILTDLSKTFGGSKMFAEPARRVRQGIEDIDSILGCVAQTSPDNVIGIGGLPYDMIPATLRDRRTVASIFDVVIGAKTIAYLVARVDRETSEKASWHLIFGVDDVCALESIEWNKAQAEARSVVTERATAASAMNNLAAWAERLDGLSRLVLVEALKNGVDADC